MAVGGTCHYSQLLAVLSAVVLGVVVAAEGGGRELLPFSESGDWHSVPQSLEPPATPDKPNNNKS